MIADFIQDTNLIIDYDEEKYNIFANDCIKNSNSLPEKIHEDAFLLINEHQYKIIFDLQQNLYYDFYMPLEFNALCLSVFDSFDNLVLKLLLNNVLLDSFDIPIENCLYQCLQEIIFNTDPCFDYAAEYIPSIKIYKRVFPLDIMSLSANLVDDDESTRVIYAQLKAKTPEGWDLILSHYDFHSELFISTDYAYPLRRFLDYIREENLWKKPNNIWLVACDSGIPNYNNYTVAQEMSSIINGVVKAPAGRVYVTETKEGDYFLYITDVRNTCWENMSTEEINKDDNIKYFMAFIKKYKEKSGNRWRIYERGKYVKNENEE